MGYSEDNLRVMSIPNSTLPRAVVFGDSFFNFIFPFFSEHFQKTVFVKNVKGFDRETIMHEQPNFIILETIERNMGDLMETRFGANRHLLIGINATSNPSKIDKNK